MVHTSIENEPLSDRCSCEEIKSIPFLDTSLSLRNKRINVDLYRKKSDRNHYLLTSSCHPIHTTKNIPFSLGLSIVRTCTDQSDRDTRLEELKELLLDRKYPERVIDSAIEKAKGIPRLVALRRVNKKKKYKRPVFAITFDPRLPSLQSIGAKHWRAMTAQDQHLQEVFPDPPLIAYKRQANIRQHLIRAKVADPPNLRPKSNIRGMVKCGKGCTACPFIKEGRNIKNNNQTWKINKKLDCTSYNIVYLIECDKDRCQKRYIGETNRSLKHRLADHRGYVQNTHLDKATGAHFNSPGHSLANMKITILEQVRKSDTEYRKQRESCFIRKFNTFNKGLNQKV